MLITRTTVVVADYTVMFDINSSSRHERIFKASQLFSQHI